MSRRVFVFFCLLTAVRSEEGSKKGITIDKTNMNLTCDGGTFPDGQTTIKMDYGSSGLYTCSLDGCTDDCPTARVKILNAENLVQLDMGALVSVLVANIVMTVLIGWVFYSICAQPRPRGSYQGNKASDRINLIENPSRSAGDTYQRLNMRSDEYSALQPQRRQKNKQSV
nr:CD3 gama/delta [Carassius auratus]